MFLDNVSETPEVNHFEQPMGDYPQFPPIEAPSAIGEGEKEAVSSEKDMKISLPLKQPPAEHAAAQDKPPQPENKIKSKRNKS